MMKLIVGSESFRNRIRVLFLSGFVVLFFLLIACFLFSFQQVSFQHYKTLQDSVFEPGNNIAIPKVLYELNRCALRKDSSFDAADSLRPVAEFLKKYPGLAVQVRNHTDYVDPKSSQKLTQCRAESCLDALVSMGIARERLQSMGCGEADPLVLQQDLVLPDGKMVPKGIVLSTKYIDTKYPGRKSAGNQFLRMQLRRTDLRVLQTDFKKQ